MSRPGFIDKRGNWKARKRRKVRLLEKFDPELGPDQARCRLDLHPRCLGLLDIDTITPDRLVPGSSYAFDGLQPACHPCQSVQGGLLGAKTFAQMHEEYIYAREKWERDFETATSMTYRPGIIAREARKANGPRGKRRGVQGIVPGGGRNEVTDFVAENPPPMWRYWLEEWHASRRDPEAAS